MRSAVIEKSSFLASSNLFLNHNLQHKQNFFLVSPKLVPLHKRNRKMMGLRKAMKDTPIMTAISEDLVKFVAAEKPEKAAKIKVRAVLTMRNKNKKDLKDTIVKHFDTFTDKIGWNVVLQLVSSEIDPKTKAPKKSN